jgi:hypothetical protein
VIALRRCEVAVRVAGRSAEPKGLWTLVLAFAVVDGPSSLVLVLCCDVGPGAGCAASEMVNVPSIWLYDIVIWNEEFLECAVVKICISAEDRPSKEDGTCVAVFGAQGAGVEGFGISWREFAAVDDDSRAVLLALGIAAY